MRMTAPALSGAAVVLAAALVSYFRPDSEPPLLSDGAAVRAPLAVGSPLPGEGPSTPMANLLASRERELPLGMVEGEREFAAEPVDPTWAPGAEADLLAKFADVRSYADRLAGRMPPDDVPVGADTAQRGPGSGGRASAVQHLARLDRPRATVDDGDRRSATGPAR